MLNEWKNGQRSWRVTMMIRQSTRVVEDISMVWVCRGIAHIACTRCTKAINTQYREEMRLLLLLGLLWMLLKVIHAWRRIRVQQLKRIEESLCNEWPWCIEHKKKKNKMGSRCMLEDSEEVWVEKSCRTVMRLVSCYWTLYHCNRFQYFIFIIQGGWEVLGRNGVLRGSSGGLNTGSWC